MAVRKPLKPGDDGSANRYPGRTAEIRALQETAAEGAALIAEANAEEPEIIGWHGLKNGELVCTFGNEAFAMAALEARTVDSITPVPAALFAEPPVTVDLACEGDES